MKETKHRTISSIALYQAMAAKVAKISARTGVLDESGLSSESVRPEAFDDMDGGGTFLEGSSKEGRSGCGCLVLRIHGRDGGQATEV